MLIASPGKSNAGIIPADITTEQLGVYKGFKAQIDSASFLGDSKGLTAVAAEVSKLNKDQLPAQLKADLRSRWDRDGEPTLDDVFLDATGRTRDREAGEVQEVTA